MPDEPLGDAYVRIQPDLEGFRAELDAQLREAITGAGGKAQIGVGVDDAEAQAKMDALRAKIDELEAKRSDVIIGMDDGRIQEQLAVLRAELADLEHQRVNIPVDADTTRAEEGLSRVRENAVAAQTANIGLSTAIVGLGPAALPVLGAVTAGAGLLAVPLAAASFGFGALAAVAGPTLSQVKNDLGNANLSLEKMPPDVAQVVSGIRQFQAEWSVLASKLQPDVLNIMNQGLNVARGLLPQLVAPAHETALALGQLGQSVQRDLNSPAWHGWASSMTGEIQPAISALGHSFGNLVAGLGGVINAFVPFAASFEVGMLRITNSFRLWGENLGTTQGFQSFMAWVKDNSAVVGHTLQDLARTFVDLGSALSGLGGIELRALDGLLKLVDSILKIPVIGPIVGDLAVLGFTVGKLAPLVSVAGEAIGAFGNRLIIMAGTIGAANVGGLAGSFSSLAAAIGPIGGILIAVSAAYAVLALHQNDVKDSAQKLSDQWTSWTKSVPLNSLDDYNAALDKTNAQLKSIDTTQADTNKTYKDSGNAIGEALQQLDQWISGTDKSSQAAKDAQKSLTDYRSGLQNAERDIKAVAQQTGLTTDAVIKLAHDNGIDLFKANVTDASLRVNAALKSDADQTGLTAGAFAQLAAESGRSSAEIVKAVQQASDATKKSFEQAGDVVKGFGSQTLPVTGLQISEFYGKQVGDAQTFSSNINKAIQAGYDPALISRILQAGPAQAGPILQGLVSNSSSAFVKMVNDAEENLKNLNQQVVEQQRLTTLAVQSNNNQMTTDLRTAMAADTIIMAQGGTASSAALAQQLNIGQDELKRILGEYGIHFNDTATRATEAGGNAGNGFAGKNAEALNAQLPNVAAALHGYDAASVNSAIVATAEGGDSGKGFADQFGVTLSGGVDPVIAIMQKYDDALGQGVNQILVATGGKPVLATIGGPGGAGGSNVAGAAATGGMLVNHPTYMVGEEAPRHPEIVLATNPAYRARNLALYEQAGQMLGVDSCGGSCKGLATGGFMSGADVPQPPTAPLLAHGSVPFGIGTGGNSAAVDEYNAVKSWADAQAAARAAAAGAGLGGSGPPATGVCADWIRQGLAFPGANASFGFDCMSARVMNESGCNPGAVNLSDSNAAAGHPSVGLTQFVPSTFASVSVPGCNDINNPICQVAASSKCSPGNCGSGGYGCATGGIPGVSCGIPGFARGGIPGSQQHAGAPWMQWLFDKVPGYPRTTGEMMFAKSMGFPAMGDGGIVTTPGLRFLGEKGPEAVVPLGQGGPFGGDVHIGGTTVIVQSDVSDSTMAKLNAWADQRDRTHADLLRQQMQARGVIKG